MAWHRTAVLYRCYNDIKLHGGHAKENRVTDAKCFSDIPSSEQGHSGKTKHHFVILFLCCRKLSLYLQRVSCLIRLARHLHHGSRSSRWLPTRLQTHNCHSVWICVGQLTEEREWKRGTCFQIILISRLSAIAI